MKANKYQELALRTKSVNDPNEMIMNGILGLCGEIGEVADIIKKWKYQGHDFNREKVIEELGDALWYFPLICEGLGVTLSEVMEQNIEKLMDRYPNGFSVEDSLFRKGE